MRTVRTTTPIMRSRSATSNEPLWHCTWTTERTLRRAQASTKSFAARPLENVTSPTQFAADDGAVCGIEGEYAPADRGKRDWDGWQLHLANHLRTRLGSTEALLHCGIERRATLGHDVCLLRVRPAPRPVFWDGKLLVRTSAQTLAVPDAERAAFLARRFPAWAGGAGG